MFLRESVSSLRAHSHVQASSADTQVSVDIDSYLKLKEMHEKRGLIDKKISRKLELLEQVRSDKTMEYG